MHTHTHTHTQHTHTHTQSHTHTHTHTHTHKFRGKSQDAILIFRVNYDEKNWKLLAKQLDEDHESIHVLNRAQIIDDSLNIARAGVLDYKVGNDLLRRFFFPASFSTLANPSKMSCRNYGSWKSRKCPMKKLSPNLALGEESFSQTI